MSNSSTADEPKTVVVAVGSGASLATFDHAVTITNARDRLLFVAAVKENGGREEFELRGVRKRVAQPDARSLRSRAVRRRSTASVFDTYAARCRDVGRQCEFRQLFFHEPGATSTRTRRWEIADTLCIAAQMNSADTLVLGHRALGRLDRSLRGSVSDHCTRNCPVSVAVVKRN